MQGPAHACAARTALRLAVADLTGGGGGAAFLGATLACARTPQHTQTTHAGWQCATLVHTPYEAGGHPVVCFAGTRVHPQPCWCSRQQRPPSNPTPTRLWHSHLPHTSPFISLLPSPPTPTHIPSAPPLPHRWLPMTPPRTLGSSLRDKRQCITTRPHPTRPLQRVCMRPPITGANQRSHHAAPVGHAASRRIPPHSPSHPGTRLPAQKQT